MMSRKPHTQDDETAAVIGKPDESKPRKPHLSPDESARVTDDSAPTGEAKPKTDEGVEPVEEAIPADPDNYRSVFQPAKPQSPITPKPPAILSGISTEVPGSPVASDNSASGDVTSAKPPQKPVPVGIGGPGGASSGSPKADEATANTTSGTIAPKKPHVSIFSPKK